MEKVAIDALIKRYRKGQISEKTLKKAIKKGFVRPKKRYIEGVEKGTRNIINQINQRNAPLFKEFNTPPIQFKELTSIKDRLLGGGFLSDIANNKIGVSNPKKISHRLTSPLISLFGRKDTLRGQAAIGARHEAYEMLESYSPKKAPISIGAGKQAKAQQLFLKTYKEKDPNKIQEMANEREKLESQANKAFSRATIPLEDFKKGLMYKETKMPKSRLGTKLKILALNGIEENDKMFRLVGNHMHPSVLAREADMVSKIPYKSITKKIKKARLKTGERQYLTHALGQDPYERGLPNKWYKKLDRTVSDHVVYRFGGKAVLIDKDTINKYNPEPQNRFKKALSKLVGFAKKIKR